jgi:GxxExxY protein
MDGKDPETYSILGAAMEVHRELGSGFLEAVYQDALEKEFLTRKTPFSREVPVHVYYKSEILNARYRVDFVVGSCLVELKSQPRIGEVETAQVLNYLKATGLKKALLLNFGRESLEYRRFVRGWGRDKPQIGEENQAADDAGRIDLKRRTWPQIDADFRRLREMGDIRSILNRF